MVCKKIFCVMGCTFVLGLGAVGAQEVQEVTIEQAVSMALEHNIGYGIEGLRLEEKLRTRNAVFSGLYPQVNVGGTFARSNVAPPMASGRNQLSLNLNVSASLVINFQIFGAIEQVSADYDAGAISFQQAEAMLRRDVQKGFYSLLLLEENLENLKAAAELAKERYEQTQENYDNGFVDEFTLLSSQVAWENLQPQVEQLRGELEKAKGQFMLTIGIDDIDAEMVLEGEIPAQFEVRTYDAEKIIEDLVVSNHDIGALRASILLLNTRISTAELQFLPTITVGFQWGPSFTGNLASDPLFDVSNWEDGGRFFVTLNQPLSPLIPASQQWVAIDNLKSQKKQQEMLLQQTIAQTQLRVRELINTVQRTQLQLEARIRSVALAERAALLAGEGYRSGGRELLVVSNAEHELQTAKLELLRERFNLLSAQLDLQHILNIDEETLMKYEN